jgi:hypothetical protein
VRWPSTASSGLEGPRRLIETSTVDRERTESNLKAALLAASIGLAAFALTFFAAILYIG